MRLGGTVRPRDGWLLVVDESRRPVGWLSTVDEPVEVTRDMLVAGGSLYEGGSLRSALDAALSSPSALGVAVDSSGAVIGAVTADDVLDALAKARDKGEVPS